MSSTFAGRGQSGGACKDSTPDWKSSSFIAGRMRRATSAKRGGVTEAGYSIITVSKAEYILSSRRRRGTV